MTPGIADGLALTFYLLFWGIIFFMLDWTLANVERIVYFSWTTVIICAGIASYVTVLLSKINA